MLKNQPNHWHGRLSLLKRHCFSRRPSRRFELKNQTLFQNFPIILKQPAIVCFPSKPYSHSPSHDGGHEKYFCVLLRNFSNFFSPSWMFSDVSRRTNNRCGHIIVWPSSCSSLTKMRKKRLEKADPFRILYSLFLGLIHLYSRLIYFFDGYHEVSRNTSMRNRMAAFSAANPRLSSTLMISSGWSTWTSRPQ